jgi:hypothetical protein
MRAMPVWWCFGGLIGAMVAHAADTPAASVQHVIVLGDEEYHARITIEKRKLKLTVQLLDRDARQPVLIENSEILINLKHAGKPKQYRLAAAPQADRPAGRNATFMLESGSLIHSLEHGDHDARLSVRIAGRAFAAPITMTADGHGHAHGPGHEH